MVVHGWQLSASQCPCDLDFVDWLRAGDVRDKVIFHFGTGMHHIVGRAARQRSNLVLGVTVSPEEFQAYQALVSADPQLAHHYQVLLADIYALPARLLPQLDIVTVFHLCEFSHGAGDDRALLASLLGMMVPGGQLLTYRGSDGYREAEPLMVEAVHQGRLIPREAAGSISVYTVPG